MCLRAIQGVTAYNIQLGEKKLYSLYGAIVGKITQFVVFEHITIKSDLCCYETNLEVW